MWSFYVTRAVERAITAYRQDEARYSFEDISATARIKCVNLCIQVRQDIIYIEVMSFRNYLRRSVEVSWHVRDALRCFTREDDVGMYLYQD